MSSTPGRQDNVGAGFAKPQLPAMMNFKQNTGHLIMQI